MGEALSVRINNRSTRFASTLFAITLGLTLYAIGLSAIPISTNDWWGISVVIKYTIPIMIAGLGIFVIGIITLVLCLVIPHKSELPSLEKSVKKSKRVLAIWHTGDRVMRTKLLRKYDSIRQVILLEPSNSKQFIDFMTETLNPIPTAIRQIREFTREADEQKSKNNKDITVKWQPEPQRMSMTIFDPVNVDGEYSDKAYVVVENPLAFVPRKERPKIKFMNTENSAFTDYVARFDQLWRDKSSRIPSPEEYENPKATE
jgi:hypothetical protein